jgi:NADP-dependent 3-hydroxy acid dehydrogenase YdfG
VLVNNSGLGINGSVVEGEPENWRTMFDVNTSFREHKVA